MAALALEIIALVTVVLSFGFAALVLVFSQRGHTRAEPKEPAPAESSDEGGATETMSRVLGEVERLAALKERGVLTAKEFATQKAKLLQDRR